MFQEFKKFAMKGNVLDLAVGVIIGAAFGKIITSVVNDIIMPVMGAMTGRVNLTYLKWVISPEREGVAELSIKYGQFLQTLLDFFIVSFSIFMIIKFINSFKKKEEEAAAEPEKPSNEELLLGEIRDILSSNNKSV